MPSVKFQNTIFIFLETELNEIVWKILSLSFYTLSCSVYLEHGAYRWHLQHLALFTWL